MRVRGSSGASIRAGDALVAAIAGIDGCGKTSTFRDAVELLSRTMPTAGVGEVVLSRDPGSPVRKRIDIPMSHSSRTAGTLAKSLRPPGLYKDLKLVEFTERTHVRDHILVHVARASSPATTNGWSASCTTWRVPGESRRRGCAFCCGRSAAVEPVRCSMIPTPTALSCAVFRHSSSVPSASASRS